MLGTPQSTASRWRWSSCRGSTLPTLPTLPRAAEVELLQVEVELIKEIAEEGRVDLLAKWMGVLVRGGHER